ncbi:hypothetical protein [Pseudoalteromonas umbrosa]|uniref:hypothetical protein n=1 Tax=Pseudoalteromonas umbrosa TaxID=3048489 RepID=UPI0024C30FD4|nr:hypothetical protein [Pseudoalteromonas sp. B95]MDK1290191.1 hypothetical protein [Pseudoalteromonas sp. B95]
MFSVFRHGLVDLSQVFDILQEKANYHFDVAAKQDGKVLLLKPRIALDVMSYEQEWLVRLELSDDDKRIRLNVVTPLQINNVTGELYSRAVGSLNTSDTPNELGYWFRRDSMNTNGKYNRPFSFLFTADSHGFAIAIWEHAVVDSPERQLSWLCIQKPVDWETGIVIPTTHNPILALSGTFNRFNAEVKQLLVRESDIPVPAPATTAIDNTYNRNSVMHTVKLKEIAENRDYIIQFPNNFSTERFSYEGVFDIIGFANTDLVSANANLTMEVFNSRRIYHSMVSTEADNAGISVMFRVG